MDSQMKLWTIYVQIGVLKAIGLDVPNFVKHVLDFVKDVPRVPKCISRWGSTTNHFFMGSQMKLWTLGDKMGVSKEIGWDVPNFTKDAPNFVKKCTKFCEECTKGFKVRSEEGINPQSLSYGFQNEIMDHKL